MRLQSTIMAVAALRWPQPSASRDRRDVAKLRNPAALNEQAPADLQGQLRHQQGRVRHRGASRLGAARRRSLLQPRQERLLRRCAVLPGDQRLHGAVRHPRQPGGPGGLARRANLKDDPVKQSNKRGFVTFAHRRSEHAHDAALHQLQGQRGARQAGLRGVRRGRRRAWTSWTRSTAATAKARRAARGRTRAVCRRKATRI